MSVLLSQSQATSILLCFGVLYILFYNFKLLISVSKGLGFGILAPIGMAVKGVLLDSSLLESAVSVEKLLVRLHFSKLELVSSSCICLFGPDHYMRSGLSM